MNYIHLVIEISVSDNIMRQHWQKWKQEIPKFNPLFVECTVLRTNDSYSHDYLYINMVHWVLWLSAILKILGLQSADT